MFRPNFIQEMLGEREVPSARVVYDLTLQVPTPVSAIRSLKARLCPFPSEYLTWSYTLPAVMMLWRSLLGLEPRASGSDASVGPSGQHP